MDFLSKDQLLAAQGRRYKVVEVPNVGRVRIASPTAAVANQLKRLAGKIEGGEDVDLELMQKAMLCIVDGEGKRVFTPEAAAHVCDQWSNESLVSLMVEVARFAAEGQEAVGLASKPGESLPNPSAASPSGS